MLSKVGVSISCSLRINNFSLGKSLHSFPTKESKLLAVGKWVQFLSSQWKSGFKKLFSNCFLFRVFSFFRPFVTTGQSNTSSKPGTLCYGATDTNTLVPANAILNAKELYSSMMCFQVWKKLIFVKEHDRGLETVVIWDLKICCITKILTFQSLGCFGEWPGMFLVLCFGINYPLFGGLSFISKATSSSVIFSSNLPTFLRPQDTLCAPD